VQQSAKGHFVWLVNKDNQAELRPVVVGEWKGEGWLISEGLNQGDKVVVDGGIRLTQAAPVKASPYVPTVAAAGAKSKSGGAPYPAAAPSGVAVYFSAGQATLDTNAQRTVRTAAAAYVGIGTQIVVTGYADKSGNAAANVELAKKRAAAVRDELVKLGVEPKRIQLVPPVNVTGAGSDDQARRVDLSVNQ
jgi:membrane fusion protein (multidrug efflux system)